MKYTNLLIALMAAICMSCSSSKNNLPYFTNIADSNEGVITSTQYDMRIACDDELAITVTSADPEATAAYNLPLTNMAKTGSVVMSTVAQQQTYIVDQAGNIQFPVLGTIHVEGLTIKEVSDKIKKQIEARVNDPVVHVDLMNFKVNVIGEVQKPGSYPVTTRRFSVLDALAAAGDLSPYGRRENVLLIREEDGVKKYHRLDLTKSDILSSPYFYLRQNDVIYVEPNNIKVEQAKYNQNNAFKISVVSTIVSACSVVASLVIALAIK